MDTKEKNKAPALHSKIKLVASRFFIIIALFAVCLMGLKTLTKSFPSAFKGKTRINAYKIDWVRPDFIEVFDSNANGFFNKSDKICKYSFSTGDPCFKRELAYYRCDSNTVSIGVYTLSGIVEFGLINKGRKNNDVWLLRSTKVISFNENPLIKRETIIPTYFWVLTNNTDSLYRSESEGKHITIRLKQDCKIGSFKTASLLRSGSTVRFSIGKAAPANSQRKKISQRREQ